MSSSRAELLRRMYEYATDLGDYVRRHDLTPEKLGASQDHQWAVVTPLLMIGECAATLRRMGEDAGPGIVLGDIAGMRNRLVHNYEGTDWNVVEEVVFQDIPDLARALHAEIERSE